MIVIHTTTLSAQTTSCCSAASRTNSKQRQRPRSAGLIRPRAASPGTRQQAMPNRFAARRQESMQRPYQPVGQRDHELNDRIASRHADRVNPNAQDQQAHQQANQERQAETGRYRPTCRRRYGNGVNDLSQDSKRRVVPVQNCRNKQKEKGRQLRRPCQRQFDNSAKAGCPSGTATLLPDSVRFSHQVLRRSTERPVSASIAGRGAVLGIDLGAAGCARLTFSQPF